MDMGFPLKSREHPLTTWVFPTFSCQLFQTGIPCHSDRGSFQALFKRLPGMASTWPFNGPTSLERPFILNNSVVT